MKTGKNNKLDFSGQIFFIGIDVHQKQWVVTIRLNGMVLKTMTMNSKPEDLNNYLQKHYPGGKFHSTYEAGFSGYSTDRKLKEYGIVNKIAHAADIPTMDKEKNRKQDKIDSKKLARELENGSIEGIYIPDEFHIELRSYCRLRYMLTKDQTRIKNRIKSYLAFTGKTIPEEWECKNWSGNFINQLHGVKFDYPSGKETLEVLLAELSDKRKRIAIVTKELKKLIGCNNSTVEQLYKTIPGIGFVTAITLYTELIDMKRFSTLERLAAYTGLIPSTDSSGEKERVRGITNRSNKYIRYMLIEAAWKAVRTDEALLQYYNRLIKRMKKTRAIISVARKLLSRIRHVWLTGQDYKIGIVN
jgi:transposase